MVKAFFSKVSILSVLVSLVFSINLNASKNEVHNLMPCSNNSTKEIYNINSLCINGEEITRKNLLDTYGGHDVKYQTKSGNFTDIVSYVNNDAISWQITSKEGLTYIYNDVTVQEEDRLVFNTVTYTGNGTSQSIDTGIRSEDINYDTTRTYAVGELAFDRTAFKLWKSKVSSNTGNTLAEDANWTEVPDNDPRLVNLSMAWIKNRSNAFSNVMYDGLRGINKRISSDQTIAEDSLEGVSDFDATGFTVSGTNTNNTNAHTYVSWQHLATHVVIGTTNHNKRYLTAYNPISGFVMSLYEGSGSAGHRIPTGVGRELNLTATKRLDTADNWVVTSTGLNTVNGDYLLLDTTHATLNSANYKTFSDDNDFTINGTGTGHNANGETFIMYGWANSELDNQGNLYGNYETGTYTGTGAAGNFVPTKGKPAYVLVKGTDFVNDWLVLDDKRGGLAGLKPNSSATETTAHTVSFDNDGFTLLEVDAIYNNLASEFIYHVIYDTSKDGGGSYVKAELNVSKPDQKKYKLTAVKESFSNSINLPVKNAEVSFYYETIAEKLLLTQIKTLTYEEDPSYYSVDFDGTNTTITSIASSKQTEILTKTYNYDEFSRIKRETINGTDIETRIVKYEYGTDGTNSIIKTINPLGQIQTNTYDENGNLISNVDYNNLATTYTYDENNQLTSQTKPDGTLTSYEYSTSDLIEDAVLKVIITTVGQPQITKYYDANNRKIRTQKVGFNHRDIIEDITYDENGRIASYSIPYFNGDKAYFINLAYDEQNRVISLDKPGLNDSRLITSYVYNADTTTITFPDGKTQTVNSDGSNIDITASYDILDNVIKTTNEKGQETTFEYDVLNRVVKKQTFQNMATQELQTTYFVYDRANFGVGKIAYEKSYEYKKEYYYDENSRLKANKVFIGDKIFATQYTYTTDGKLDKTVSPDGFVTINEYNDLGFLSAIKSPKSTSVELDFDNVKELITQNLKTEYEIYNEYYDLKAKVNFYALKKVVYEDLSAQYASIDASIQAQLNSVSILLGETIVLLQENITKYENIILNNRKIRESHLIPNLTQSNVEENFQWLSEVFSDKSEEYASLSMSSIDKASSLLEGIITQPQILNDAVNIDQDLIAYYKNQANDIVAFASNYSALSNSYQTIYEDLQAGNGNLQESAYLGMFDNNEFKYFYKINSMDALGRVTNEIYGNGLVTKKEFDAASGSLIRLTTGYYGNSDIKDIQYTYDVNNNLLTQFDSTKGITKNYKYDESNVLISATNVGEDFYSNIAYDYAPVSEKYSYDESANEFSSQSLTLSLNVPNSIESIDGINKAQTIYSDDKKSYKKIYTVNEQNSTVYKVNQDFKYEITDGKTNYKNLIYANGKLVSVHSEEDLGTVFLPNNYYIHKDVFDSIDIITNESAAQEKQINYRPYGEQSDISWGVSKTANSDITNIGYKGFESESLFNLLDINGYVYDPTNAKTLSNNAISSLEENLKDLYISSSPTKYINDKLNSWYKDVTVMFSIQNHLSNNPKSLYNLEMSKDIKSISSSTNNIYIGDIQPTDTSKIWYRQNEEGSLTVLIYQDGSWVEVGDTGSMSTTGSVTVDSISMLNSIPCFYQDSAFINLTAGAKSAYTCNDTQEWELGGEFVGTFTLLDLVDNLNAKAGSKINATVPNVGTVEFTKTASYWIDATNTYIVANTLVDVKTNSMSNESYAYVPKDSSTLYNLKKMDIASLSKWAYLADGYDDVVSNFNAIETVDEGYVYDTKNSKSFKQTNSVWNSSDDATQLSSHSSGRNIFTNLSANYSYYTSINDCTDTTCNGDVSNGYYGGEKVDNMYLFNYSTAGNRLNNLIDPYIASSIADMYDSQMPTVLYGSNLYFKDADSNGQITYKDTAENFYTKVGIQYPSAFIISGVLNLPPSVSSSTASFSGESLVLASRTQATDWTSAPSGVTASILETNYTHISASGKDFWTNDASGDGQENATEIFTAKGRSALPTITHSLRVMTKQLCTLDAACAKTDANEPRYTDAGVVSSIDSTFYEWFYSVTGTTVNNLLDGSYIVIDSAISGTYNYSSAVTSQFGSVLAYNILVVDANIIGATGATGANGTYSSRSGKTGGTGQYAINLSGFSGTTVKIINNATIKGGNGGRGGNGYYESCTVGPMQPCTSTTIQGGSGGSGRSALGNTSGVSLIQEGNAVQNGSGGSKGSNGRIIDYG